MVATGMGVHVSVSLRPTGERRQIGPDLPTLSFSVEGSLVGMAPPATPLPPLVPRLRQAPDLPTLFSASVGGGLVGMAPPTTTLSLPRLRQALRGVSAAMRNQSEHALFYDHEY